MLDIRCVSRASWLTVVAIRELHVPGRDAEDGRRGEVDFSNLYGRLSGFIGCLCLIRDRAWSGKIIPQKIPYGTDADDKSIYPPSDSLTCFNG